MDKTPRVRRGSKSSPVRVTKPDGTQEMRPAYKGAQLQKITGENFRRRGRRRSG